MHDLVIRNGTIIDGSGKKRYVGDLSVDNGLISKVGSDVSAGRREIDATDLFVLPGWVDVHAHYDGQATWDPYLTPSTWHGVTTSIFGNCGVGFAPVKAGTEDYLINLMQGVEDIPGTVLSEGMNFDWESFPEYLDVLESMPRAIDIGAQVPHGALRFFVMGERGADHKNIPYDGEVEQMALLLEEALNSGALGFTTSRTTKHKAADGRFTPSLSANKKELLGLARAMRRAGKGVFECNSDFGPGEFAALREVAEISGRPLSVLLLQVDAYPDLWRDTLSQIHAANRAGINVNGQVGCRPIGILMGLETSLHPFSTHPAWKKLESLSPSERVQRIEQDGNLRRSLIETRPKDPHTTWMECSLSKSYEFGDPPDYEPDPTYSISARAEKGDRDPWDLALELMLRNNGKGLLLYPFENYTGGNLEVVREMLKDEYTICGLGDAGAHVATICDASYPTFMLTHWARDRKRGKGLPMEYLIAKQTSKTARAFGLSDRGVLARGYQADINIVDFSTLAVTEPELVYDLPAGGRRFIQRAVGYNHTFVRGVEVLHQGELTGALPGALIRGSQTKLVR